MIDLSQLDQAQQKVLRDLLAARNESGHWEGRLSSSALSTATAASALALVDRHAPEGPQHRSLIDRALDWLIRSVNEDGGWGDTDQNRSNLATTMLVRAAFYLSGAATEHEELLHRADQYVDRQGGIAGLRRRYGRDKTFAVPILTNCALAGLVPWSEVAPLPFELACLPHSLLRIVRLPVVSYALPALVAIGQARYFHAPPRNPLSRMVRKMTVRSSLEKLRAMQPESGGYLEAAPLTSFVVMSLAATGRVDHTVVRHGVQFLVDSVREDGSWPIDTNLATWNTTLAVNALPAEHISALESREALCDWILGCQHRSVHPFTQAAAGGWGWTDKSGAVPDADDTAGALLALARFTTTSAGCLGHSAAVAQPLESLGPRYARSQAPNMVAPVLNRPHKELNEAAQNGIRWLLNLQNADGGWPTFCRGWGALPFDRSGADLTAHALRALHAWKAVAPDKIDKAIQRGLEYLARMQRDDGSWIPLWFGNEHDPDEANPVFGTARVLLAYRDLAQTDSPLAHRGTVWLVAQQNTDGGWGGDLAALSSVEETAVAVEALLAYCADPSVQVALQKGLGWLLRSVAENQHQNASPIGFYFARLWYYETMYPLVFTASALSSAVECLSGHDKPYSSRSA